VFGQWEREAKGPCSIHNDMNPLDSTRVQILNFKKEKLKKLSFFLFGALFFYGKITTTTTTKPPPPPPLSGRRLRGFRCYYFFEAQYTDAQKI
jgi:hypothetical protein